MTEQEKYMKAALKLAHKASDAAGTAVKPRKTPCITPKSRQSKRRAASSAAGGCTAVTCM